MGQRPGDWAEAREPRVLWCADAASARPSLNAHRRRTQQGQARRRL